MRPHMLLAWVFCIGALADWLLVWSLETSPVWEAWANGTSPTRLVDWSYAGFNYRQGVVHALVLIEMA